MYDYANTSDLLDMAFTVDEGTGYTIEASIAAEALEGYDPNATIGFTYAADKDNVGLKFQWEKANLGNGYWENPSMWLSAFWKTAIFWAAFTRGNSFRIELPKNRSCLWRS